MNTYSNYNDANEIISLVHKAFPEFEKGYAVQIIFSDETPPIFQSKSDEEIDRFKDKFPIDELLGTYTLETKEIKIYLQGIRWATEIQKKKILEKNVFFEELLKIVILHELGHFWFHNVSFLNEAPSDKPNSPEIDEWVAQMFTFYCIENCIENKHDLMIIFEELMKNQPIEYKIDDFHRNIVVELFKEIVEEVRKEKTEIKSWGDFIKVNLKVNDIREWASIKEIVRIIEEKKPCDRTYEKLKSENNITVAKAADPFEI